MKTTMDAKVVITSGYFNPLHIGHLRLLQEASKLGSLIVIVNNDEQVRQKGSVPFMPEEERVEIIRAIRNVSVVVLSKDRDRTVRETLRDIVTHPENDHTRFIFAKGGDSFSFNTPEADLCRELGVEILYGVGGDKIQASSRLIKQAQEHGAVPTT